MALAVTTTPSDNLTVTRQLAWYGLGRTLQNAPSAADALKQAGMDWKVVQAPIQWRDKDGKLQKDERYLCNYREDTGQLFGVVGQGYTIVQNDAAFEFADNLLKEGFRFTQAWELNGGRTVCLCMEMPELRILQDAFVPTLHFLNGHDGRTAVNVSMAPIRQACLNTLNLELKLENAYLTLSNSIARRWGFAHRPSVMYRIHEARETLCYASEYMQRLKSTAEQLAVIKLGPLELIESMERLFPKPGVPALDKRVQEKIDRLTQCYNEPDLDNFRGTAYGFLAAVSDYTTHVSFRSKDVERARERHFVKTVMQPALLLAKAFDMFAG